MRIRYIYSACVSIATPDCTILCDPWFGEAYDGAWVQWPRIDNPLEVCGPSDYVYISHIHPDHYDPTFLKAYLAKYTKAQVIIADMTPGLLQRKLVSRGIMPRVIDHLDKVECGTTTIRMLPNCANSVNIDSALVVRRDGLSVANLNDNPFDDIQLKNIRHVCNGSPTVALLPFVGAGPWPQCYEMDSDVRLMAALAKKRKYLQLFSKYCQALQPKIAVPFAGQYWLHGDRLNLNNLRGMADATECYPLWKHVWVPSDGGNAELTLENQEEWKMSGVRHNPYEWPTVREALDKMHILTHDVFQYRAPAYRYEREIQVPVERLPLLKLLQSAADNAYDQFRSHNRHLNLCIKTQLPQWFVLDNYRPLAGTTHQAHIDTLTPRIEVYLDARYLFGMLTRLYNANSVRIGSLCRFKVVPEVYDKELDDLFGEYWDSLRV